MSRNEADLASLALDAEMRDTFAALYVPQRQQAQLLASETPISSCASR